MKQYFTSGLLKWFAVHRRSLPWRENPAPYQVLVSECMLQQTQVSRVMEKFPEFLARFPSIAALARASKADVIKAWSGMGYNRRALLLQKCAQAVMKEHGGNIPNTAQKLLKLPGIGAYTAGAIASFAYNLPEPAIDVNVRRIYMRYFHGKDQGAPSGAEDEKQLYEFVRSTLPGGKSRELHNALMDFGSLVCKRKAPACSSCPLQKQCSFFPLYGLKKEKALFVMERPREKGVYENGKFTPDRLFRGRIVEYARQHEGKEVALEELGNAVKSKFAQKDTSWLLQLCRRLEKDGLITFKMQGKKVRLLLPG